MNHPRLTCLVVKIMKANSKELAVLLNLLYSVFKNLLVVQTIFDAVCK